MNNNIEVVIKLSLAVLFGGIVGFEREHKSRPAGLRTHILVCIGATLVQIIAFSYYNEIKGKINTDPMRLGAQVISGIGFLGAGTIMKEGVNIKGLTTAATLWVVACIGLAIGSGYYVESMIATAFVYISLESFKGLESYMKSSNNLHMKIKFVRRPGAITEITTVLEEMDMTISNIETYKTSEDMMQINLAVENKAEIENKLICEKLLQIDYIKEIIF